MCPGIIHRDSVEAHRASAQAIPPAALEQALIAGAPSGAYYDLVRAHARAEDQ